MTAEETIPVILSGAKPPHLVRSATLYTICENALLFPWNSRHEENYLNRVSSSLITMLGTIIPHQVCHRFLVLQRAAVAPAN